jgi:signal transduction histidine kinase
MNTREKVSALLLPVNPSRSDWVDMQLIRVFMRDAVIGLYATLVATVVVSVLLFSDIPLLQICSWAFAQAVVALARVWVIRRYRRSLREASGEPLSAFIRRYEWLWPLSAFVWGCLVWLFFLRASTFDQFVCLLILVGVASMSVTSFGARLKSALLFLDILHISVLTGLIVRLATATERLPPTYEIAWLCVLVVMYWALVRIGATRFNKVLRSGFEAQFDNSVLIASLTEKSRAALQAVSTKDRFIASAAHDLRQPVHALNLYAGWLMNDPHLVEQLTPKIVRSTQVLDELFDSLFYFSGLNSDPLRVKLQAVDLPGLLQDMKQQFDATAVERNVDLHFHCEAGTLCTDPILIKRLLGNFLTNAFKHTQYGSVTLSAKWRKNKWRIEVTDTGPGIAEVHQKAIFEEFYRAPSPGTEEGFGLGLAIVVRLSRALSHRVGLRSAVGQGSTFWVDVNSASPQKF